MDSTWTVSELASSPRGECVEAWPANGAVIARAAIAANSTSDCARDGPEPNAVPSAPSAACRSTGIRLVRRIAAARAASSSHATSRAVHACTTRVSDTTSSMSASSAAQNEMPAAVAPSSTIARAVATTPSSAAPSTIARARRANRSERTAQSVPAPATRASAGSQTSSRNTIPPIASAIARYPRPRAVANAALVIAPLSASSCAGGPSPAGGGIVARSFCAGDDIASSSFSSSAGAGGRTRNLVCLVTG